MRAPKRTWTAGDSCKSSRGLLPVWSIESIELTGLTGLTGLQGGRLVRRSRSRSYCGLEVSSRYISVARRIHCDKGFASNSSELGSCNEHKNKIPLSKTFRQRSCDSTV